MCGTTDPSGSYILCNLCCERYKYTATLLANSAETRVKSVAMLRKECPDLLGPLPHTGLSFMWYTYRIV